MQASQTSILHLLRIPNQQFVIPVYQRTYKWTHIHCGQLFSDILKASGSTSKNHFIGSIVHISDQNIPVTKVKPLTIIDGQQRLTTISLLLLAIKNYLDEHPNPNITSNEINQYLVNSDKKDDEYIKLQLTKQDREVYFSLINKTEIDVEYHNILNNYMYFYNSIKSGQRDIEALYEGIAKLIIVEVSLEREHDDPQLIFESLNSTGEKLTEADLIRNFLLMDLTSSFQKKIYNHYWFPIETRLREENKGELSNFIRDYLTFKTKKIPKKTSVYSDFKDYFKKYYSREPESIENLMKELLQFAGYYERILRQNEKDKEINDCLKDLDSIDIKIIYPLILPLYYDYENQLLSKEDFISILRLIESYLIRRVICGYPTQGLNKVFVSIVKDLDRTNHLVSFETILANKKGNHRFPNNDEFKKSFLLKDIYNLSNKNRKYILFKLEHHCNPKERLQIDPEITIEHILPQSPNLSDKWVNALGSNWKEVHNTYVHTIGNLTLTGYNKNMSNKFFTDKRDLPGGFADSLIRLNKGLHNLDTWNETEILKRANNLFEYAKEAWNYPELDLLVTNDDNRPIVTLDDDWTSLRPSSFVFLTDNYEARDFTDIYYKVIKKIYDLDSNSFLEAINQEELLSRRFHSLNQNDFNNQPRQISENIYLNTNINNEQKRKNLITLFEKTNIDEEDLIIYLS
ncbi:hypothetical protein CVD25_22890 [Bacillus canaveralius]|uniref:DUF262 domain-containing protein n=1 Tax=Bacillus canaveralius TaxID=1403243 RepID=A0A2N5GGV3_9BACI|nr:DUF262 domain-containing protein [Bacillus canaveralius]PLR79962.1 hypothetical protein CU635_20330 [Bacillus canaveralius]PLR88280.1 hypothetical protein CVD25_22890 [Bacillus canaveralius]